MPALMSVPNPDIDGIRLKSIQGPGSPISPKPSPNKVQKPGAKRGRKPKAQTAAKEAQAKDEPEAKEEHDEDDHKAEVDKTSENEA